MRKEKHCFPGVGRGACKRGDGPGDGVFISRSETRKETKGGSKIRIWNILLRVCKAPKICLGIFPVMRFTA
ncbi:hypothetical protein V6N12_003349 [Hibiscus sabdariffa]|uniref:Uncharacterized protein n=1 Tax=Hibiscus sabdariffa TaxID=183260 RepID=A0ABR2ED41_9ROSI